MEQVKKENFLRFSTGIALRSLHTPRPSEMKFMAGKTNIRAQYPPL